MERRLSSANVTTDVRVRTGCNNSGPTFSGLDNCDGVFAPSVADGGKTLTSGNSEWAYSQTWTATYTDACLNASCTSSITTWKEANEYQ
jgi:hypothetical protein